MNIEDTLKQQYLKEFIKSRENIMDEMSHEDLLVIILKSHMFIEQELYQLLLKVMKNPEKLKVRYLLDKLNLAFTLGLIEQELYSSLKKLNDFRNEYAHKLNFEFTEKELQELISPLSKEQKTNIEIDLYEYGKFEEEGFKTKVRVTLAYLCTEVKFSYIWAYKAMEERIFDFKLDEIEMALKKNETC